jgi:hypothetical protein
MKSARLSTMTIPVQVSEISARIQNKDVEAFCSVVAPFPVLSFNSTSYRSLLQLELILLDLLCVGAEDARRGNCALTRRAAGLVR